MTFSFVIVLGLCAYVFLVVKYDRVLSLYVQTSLTITYCSGSSLQISRRKLFLRVVISKFCVLTAISFVLFTTDTSRGSESSFGNTSSSHSARVREFMNSVGLFQAICQCSFGRTFVYLAHGRSDKEVRESLRCRRQYVYIGLTGVVLNVSAKSYLTRNKIMRMY